MTKSELSIGRNARMIIGLFVTLTVIAASAGGQSAFGQQSTSLGKGGMVGNDVPREVENVTIEQKLGGQIPLNLALTDSLGRQVDTGSFIDGKKPTIITLNYSDCPMLCNVQLSQLSKSLNELGLQVGRDFQILTVSIDPKETSETIRKTKNKYVELLLEKQPNVEEGWEFCTAEQPVITRLTDSLGFQYTYDEKTGEYYHPAMLAFISPKGVITRYSLAVAFEPSDLNKALVEAGDGTVGSPVDQIILWCFSYDPTSNSYVPQAWRIMRLAGAATIGLMLACLTPYWLGRKRRPAANPDDTLDTDGLSDNSHTEPKTV